MKEKEVALPASQSSQIGVVLNMLSPGHAFKALTLSFNPTATPERSGGVAVGLKLWLELSVSIRYAGHDFILDQGPFLFCSLNRSGEFYGQ